MISIGEFEEFIHNDFVYTQKLISVINEEGKQIFVDNLSELYKFNACTIKLEHMEIYSKEIYDYCKLLSSKYNNDLPVTCHVFRAFRQSLSFGLHTDPDDVILRCIWGKKRMSVNGKIVDLYADQEVFIPANTPHEALNDEESLMLSFGLEDFYKNKIYNELDVLPKNHGNVQSEL